MEKQEILIDYTNHRGQRGWRRIRPVRISFEESSWHPGVQWILFAVDVDLEANREFAMKDIHAWRPQ